MKGLLRWLLVPAVVLAGLVLAAPERSQAARWSVHVRGAYPFAPNHYVYRQRGPRRYGWPGPVVAPVYPAPVIVAPRPYRVYYAPPRPVYPVPHYYVW